MRMHRKRNLEPRMQEVDELLVYRGKPCRNLKEAAQSFRALIDYAQTFGNGNPVELEIGCGNGAFVAQKAAREPNVNFLAVEICTNVIVTAMERVKNEGLQNVRFLNIAAEILPCFIAPGSIDRIYLNFSTPLPEASREKQRLTSVRFLEIYKTLLKDGGEIIQKTDSEAFFRYSLRMYRENGFEICGVTEDLHHSEYAKENIVTEYEHNFASQGLPIYRAAAVLHKSNGGTDCVV